MADEKKLEGLRGWLILVGLGIIASPIKISFQIYPVYSKLFTDGSWAALTTPGTESYHPLWAPILISEISINVALALTWLFIAFLFFAKKRFFPKWYIGIFVFTLAFMLVDAVAIRAVLPNEEIFDPDTIKELARTLVTMLIWVPYMLMSKRVKATFVK